MSSIVWTDKADALGVDIYRTDDYSRVGRADLPPLLRGFFQNVLGRPLPEAKFRLFFHAVEDPTDLPGEPAMVNLRRSHGLMTVLILEGDRLIYRHPHLVREVFATQLQRLLAVDMPEEKHWGYGVAGPGLESVALVRPAPQIDGAVALNIEASRPRRFHVEEPPEAALPETSMAELGVAGPVTTQVGVLVVLDPQVNDALLRSFDFSREVEEGGFLVGRVYADRDRPGRDIVHVTHALPAERSGASLLQFTFTGESFLRINYAIPDLGEGLRLVGWYHTHLFAATEGLGLSTIDVDLHRRTFLRPWQVAALLNVTDDGRQLRIYAWDGSAMHMLPFWLGTT